jgi:hypothetical protein
MTIVLCLAVFSAAGMVVAYLASVRAGDREAVRLREEHEQAERFWRNEISSFLPDAVEETADGKGAEASKGIEYVVGSFRREREAYAALRSAQGLPAPDVEREVTEYRRSVGAEVTEKAAALAKVPKAERRRPTFSLRTARQ